ncbi:hypothetical protein LTR65_001933 [Meristemomyces frigidus]
MGQAKRDRRQNAIDRKALGHILRSTSRHVVQQNSHMLLLPVELRINIYSHLMTSSLTLQYRDGQLSTPALARVCRQLRNECLPLFNATWSASTRSIVCQIHNFNFDQLICLLDRISPEAFDGNINDRCLTRTFFEWMTACALNYAQLPTPCGQYEVVGVLPQDPDWYWMYPESSSTPRAVRAEWKSILRAFRLARSRVDDAAAH